MAPSHPRRMRRDFTAKGVRFSIIISSKRMGAARKCVVIVTLHAMQRKQLDDGVHCNPTNQWFTPAITTNAIGKQLGMQYCTYDSYYFLDVYVDYSTDGLGEVFLLWLHGDLKNNGRKPRSSSGIFL